ncbi:hypothetical protein MSG28_000723 [Choristoneura fumiferana]|uniref:Uncharacterized protein n=1 Tax=Choristoneura fumiferana TaxID=7141 RepID=A0ACC0K200_CHOFU|nr:hypothetical protein MSG28_000723 [Choristoneura fumiferana]
MALRYQRPSRVTCPRPRPRVPQPSTTPRLRVINYEYLHNGKSPQISQEAHAEGRGELRAPRVATAVRLGCIY